MEWATQGSHVLGTRRYQGLIPEPRVQGLFAQNSPVCLFGRGKPRPSAVLFEPLGPDWAWKSDLLLCPVRQGQEGAKALLTCFLTLWPGEGYSDLQAHQETEDINMELARWLWELNRIIGSEHIACFLIYARCLSNQCASPLSPSRLEIIEFFFPEKLENTFHVQLPVRKL